jgi:fatty acid desaturase
MNDMPYLKSEEDRKPSKIKTVIITIITVSVIMAIVTAVLLFSMILLPFVLTIMVAGIVYVALLSKQSGE